MKRLKKAEFYDAFMNSNDMMELYKNPTDSEIELVKKQDPYGDVRGVIYNDGTKIIWPANGSGHFDLNEKIEKNVDIYQFRYVWENSSNEWIMDVDRGLTWDETVNYIRKYKDFLSKIGNINGRYYIMAKDHSGNWQFLGSDNVLKIARLKHAKFYDGIMMNEEMLEIYINPTHKEFEFCANSNDLDAIRITFCDNGTVYTWNGEIFHGFIENQHPECANGLHAVYIRDDNELVIYPASSDTFNDILGYFTNCQSFLNQHNMINAKLEIFTGDYNGTKFPEYKEWHTVSDIYNFIDNM